MTHSLDKNFRSKTWKEPLERLASSNCNLRPLPATINYLSEISWFIWLGFLFPVCLFFLMKMALWCPIFGFSGYFFHLLGFLWPSLTYCVWLRSVDDRSDHQWRRFPSECYFLFESSWKCGTRQLISSFIGFQLKACYQKNKPLDSKMSNLGICSKIRL